MQPHRQRVEITTAPDGTAVAYSGEVNGRLASIQYVKDGSTPFDDGVNVAVVGAITGQNVWTQAAVNASVQKAPRQPTCDNTGTASLFAAGGEPVEDYYVVANERLKITITNGGTIKKGLFWLTFI